ncbi:MAG TPA: response regulator [Silvibacterium sp.]|nr:response regulator [Silvibacterium sp.]
MAKILCVDDDPDVIALKRIILEQAGYEVTTCISAEDAIREIQRVAFDGIVTDWRLGRDRGRAIVEAAKAQSAVPVVVVSGFVKEAFQAAEPMADIYLEKPEDPRELVKILDTLLDVRSERRSSE